MHASFPVHDASLIVHIATIALEASSASLTSLLIWIPYQDLSTLLSLDASFSFYHCRAIHYHSMPTQAKP